MKLHPLIGLTLWMGYGLFLKGKLSTIDSPLSPILGNPQFEPDLKKGSFGRLIEQGLFQFSHFVSAGSWPTVQEITGPAPYQLDFWRALQLRHFLDTLILPSRYKRTLEKFEEYYTGSGILQQTLSKMSLLLSAPPEVHSGESIMNPAESSVVKVVRFAVVLNLFSFNIFFL